MDQIFSGLVFRLDESLDFIKRSQLTEDLVKHGGEMWDSESTSVPPTHIIAEQDLPSATCPVVLSEWVTAALRNGFTHDPKYYIPDSTKILTGVVVATTGLPERDEISIFGATLALGGQCRDSFTKDVTHLVCLAPHGEAYEKAIDGTVKVILPHWFDYCFKLCRLVREDIFVFPNPTFLQAQDDTYTADIETKITPPLPRPDPFIHPQPPTIDQVNSIEPTQLLFKDTLVYIHSDISMLPIMSDQLFKLLEQSGAKVTLDQDDIKDSNQRLVIYVFRYRSSDLYRTAATEGRMIVNLSWITNTLSRGYFDTSLRTLWDYPLPKGNIPGMEKLTVTITGYEADSRFLIFQLCNLVGLRWTPNLETDTSLIICSKPRNLKYKVGRARNCDIVNHLWLEDCFRYWDIRSITLDRYTCFPEYNILQHAVGNAPLIKGELNRWNNLKTLPATAKLVPPNSLCGALKDLRSSPGYTPPRQLNDDSTKSEMDWERQEDTPEAASVPPKLEKGKRRSSSAVSGLRSKRPKVDDNTTEHPLSPHEDTDSQASRSLIPPRKKPTSPLYSGPIIDKDMPSTATTEEAAESSSSRTIPRKRKPKSSLDSGPTMDKDVPSTATTEEAAESSSSRITPRKRKPTASLDKSQKGEGMPIKPAEPNTVYGSAQTSAATEPDDDDEKDSAPPDTETDALTLVHCPTTILTSSWVANKAEEKSIKKLGSHLVSDITEADVLVVTDRILRTPKFLCAVNLGTTIVSRQWLLDSIEEKKWCDPSKYQIQDSEMEDTYGFSLQASLRRAQQSIKQQLAEGKARKGIQGTWLLGYEVCALSTASGQKLKDVVETAGGKFIQIPKRHALETKKKDHTKLLALANKDDKKRNGWKDIQAYGFGIYDQELVVVGSLCQELRLEAFVLG